MQRTGIGTIKTFAMKYIVLLTSGLLLFCIVFGQPEPREYFLERSKKQKTTAWILLGTGATAIITGAIIDNSHKDEEQSFTGGFVEVGGIICSLASIPFFISSSGNKKRAVIVTLNNRKVVPGKDNLLISRRHSSISLRIALRH